MILTTRDLSNIRIDTVWLTPNEISRLCRTKQLFAWKNNPDKPFDPWNIPDESVAMYLHYHPAFAREREAIKAMHNQNGITGAIGRALQNFKSPRYDTYTVGDLSKIFGLPTNQICTRFEWRTGFYAKIVKLQLIPIITVVEKLKDHPEWVDELWDRHKMLLAANDRTADDVRHLLMLHSYYITNGYLL